MFKGTYRHRIDPKGRLPIPAMFRRALGEQGAATVVVTVLDECLAAYAPAEWGRLESQLLAMPSLSRPVKALTRLLTSRATDCEIDVQGRILLSAPMRAAAALDREAVVIGVLNRFEVWAPERWDIFLAESERLLDDVTLDVPWPLLPQPSPEALRAAPHPQEKPKR